MSAVAAAGIRTQNLISKKCDKLEKTAVLSWGMLLWCILTANNPSICET